MPRNPQQSPASLAVLRVFQRACDELTPLAPSQPGVSRRLLLACSAGGDSMALLDLCARASADRHWQLAVAHVDHARRPESAGEAHFVAEQAGGRGIEFFAERLDPADDASEEALRDARHAALARTLQRWPAEAVLLAHQADDVAETLLMRLLSGAGPTGLAAIQPMADVAGLLLVRPLLAARRADLRQYLRERDLGWHDDPSNADPGYKRNWVRHALLPLATERLGHDPTPHLARAADLIGAEAQALREAARILLDQMELPPETSGALGILDLTHPVWCAAGPALRAQLLRQWLWRRAALDHPPLRATVEQALEFASRHGRATLRTVAGLSLTRGDGRLILRT